MLAQNGRSSEPHEYLIISSKRRNALPNIFEGVQLEMLRKISRKTYPAGLSDCSTTMDAIAQPADGDATTWSEVGSARSTSVSSLKSWCMDSENRPVEVPLPRPFSWGPAVENCAVIRGRRNALHDLLETITSSELDKLKAIHKTIYHRKGSEVVCCH